LFGVAPVIASVRAVCVRQSRTCCCVSDGSFSNISAIVPVIIGAAMLVPRIAP
jgi:hypothetical protein